MRKAGQLAVLLAIMALACMPAAAKGKQEAAGAEKKEIVEISITTWKTNQEFIFKDQSKYKELEGIKVDFQGFAFTDYYPKLKVELAANQGADVIVVQPGSPFLQFKQFFIPLKDYAARDLGAQWKSDFDDAAMKEIESYGAELYGLPIGMVIATYIWYNKDLFSQYGVKPPKTYEELKQVAQLFRNNKVLPLVQGAKDAWINLDVIMAIANDINRTKFYDALDGKIQWTDPDLVQAFTYWKRFFDDGVFQDGALGIIQYMDAMDMFIDGKAAMICQGSWNLGAYANWGERYSKYGRALFRFVDINGDGKPAPLTSSIDQIIAVNKFSKHPEEAWRVAKFMAAGEGAKEYYGTMDVIPTYQKISVDTTSLSAELKENFAAVLESTKDIAGYRELPNPELKKAVEDALTIIALGQKKPSEALAEVEKVSRSIKR